MKTIKLLIPFLAILFVANIQLQAQINNITVTMKRNDDNSISLDYKKELPGSYFITIDITSITNCYQDKIEKVVNSSSGNICQLKPIDPQKGIDIAYKYTYLRGNPYPKIDRDFAYLLPFKTGDSIHIIETTSINEKYLDGEKDDEWKSYLTYRSNADTVYCMRKGIVVGIEDNFKIDNSKEYRFTSNMNSILIEHKDGTVARYSGFDKNNIYVKLGDQVYPQTKLGKLVEINTSDYRLYFSVIYLNKERLMNKEETEKKGQSVWADINPRFLNKNLPTHLQHDQTYIVECNDDIFFKEFNRREKKLYTKDKSDFQ